MILKVLIVFRSKTVSSKSDIMRIDNFGQITLISGVSIAVGSCGPIQRALFTAQFRLVLSLGPGCACKITETCVRACVRVRLNGIANFFCVRRGEFSAR